MRYEVIERTRGDERIVARTRRENGAINERDNAVASAYANARRHAESGGWAIQGPDGRDPNAVVVAFGVDGTVIYWTYTYRLIRPRAETDRELEDALVASIVAVNAATI